MQIVRLSFSLLFIAFYYASIAQGGGVNSYCSLPAPTDVTYNFTTPNEVSITWGKVNGAWGYQATLTNNTTYASETKIIESPVSMVTFNAPPGEYTFQLCSKCKSTDASPNCYVDPIVYLPSFIIVADIVVEMAVPSTGPTIWQLPVLNNEATSNVGIPVGSDYCLSFNYGAFDYVEAYLKRVFSPYFNGFVVLSKDENNGDWTFSGLQGTLNPANGGIVYQKIRISKPGKGTMDLSFLGDVNLRFSLIGNPGGQSFNNIRLYDCDLNEGQGGKPGSDQSTTAIQGEYLSMNRNSAVPNPFKNNLNIVFAELPQQNVTLKLFDATGRLEQEFLVHPDELTDNYYTLDTETLAEGLYFLQIQGQSGERQVIKVVKTE
jgi:Secretion system C-terminal sorting domain